jgi:hypothetical protein
VRRAVRTDRVAVRAAGGRREAGGVDGREAGGVNGREAGGQPDGLDRALTTALTARLRVAARGGGLPANAVAAQVARPGRQESQ